MDAKFTSFAPTSTNQSDEAAWWQAVLDRDARLDGTFVYGVLSTRIFCRPSCPSRRPKREGARLFASSENANAAGFRACKRCRPADLQSTPVARLEAACRFIEAAGETNLTLRVLSGKVGISSHHLQRTFKAVMGVSPREYSDALRLNQIKIKLKQGENVTNALYDAGYNSSRALYERAPSQLGMTPATYGRGGKGAQIIFGVTPCALGFLLVASTPTGICSIALGDDAAVLEATLRREFFAADVQRDEANIQQQIQAVLQVSESGKPREDLPLDVQATAFQRRVWQALREIRRGQTRTYTQVAKTLGQPTAARAVARACAANPVALVIPCHRVVREDGSMAGYRWGLERKEKLLAREAKLTEPMKANRER